MLFRKGFLSAITATTAFFALGRSKALAGAPVTDCGIVYSGDVYDAGAGDDDYSTIAFDLNVSRNGRSTHSIIRYYDGSTLVFSQTAYNVGAGGFQVKFDTPDDYWTSFTMETVSNDSNGDQVGSGYSTDDCF